ncbi:MAG TPA: tyrosine--tRNA ligase [Pseudonocardiaceae bacterium]|nr:tyrosine--tRNA ligase [Pseudonocardiaceae bacterium]
MSEHILDELSWRDLIARSADNEPVATDLEALRKDLDSGPLTLYCGFDPTAPSLHMGNLAQIMTVRRFQRAGNKPLGLVGGATGLIGDPRPNSERALNSRETVADWVMRIRAQIEPLLDFTGSFAATMVDNLDWTESLTAIDFLRDVGKHFRVNRLLAKEAISTRLNSDAGLSYTEFSYQLLQALDFLNLYQRYGCTLQTGGSDQWGNLTSGVDLIHRVTGRSVHALATPLITKADGTKFGKTESGSIWLDPELTSPYAFFQFWVNSDDKDVVTYLKVFTDLSRDEIDDLAERTATAPAARAAQRELAEQVTTLVHGADETERVVAASQALFGRGELRELSAATLAAAMAEAPTGEARLGDGGTIVDLLVASGLVESRSAGRRAVKEGGAYVNNAKITDEEWRPTSTDLLDGGWLVLRRGKRHTAGVRLVG